MGRRLVTGAAVMAAVALATPSPATRAAPATAAFAEPATLVTVDAGAPGAALRQDLIGANHVTAGSTAALAAIGARWARTDVSFEVSTPAGSPVYDCATGAWDPSVLDARVATDRAAGMTPELLVDYTPTCLASPTSSGDPHDAPPDLGPDRAKWMALVTEMAEHEIGAEGVRVFEVWNEPDGLFWTGGLSGYLQLYVDTATALRSAARARRAHIEIGGPALAAFGGIEQNWVTGLAATAVADRLPLDFVSWHYYADYPDIGPSNLLPGGLCLTGPSPPGQPCWYSPHLDAATLTAEAQAARAALAAFPTLHPKLWVDEWNVDAGEDARQDTAYGGAFVADVLEHALAAGVERMAFYDAQDPVGDPTQNFGMLTPTGAPKPSYDAFLLWRRLAGDVVPSAVAPSPAAPAGDEIDATATRAGGVVKVLVVNFAPFDPTGGYGARDPNPYDERITVAVLHLAGRYRLVRTVVDARHAAIVVSTRVVTVRPGAVARVACTVDGESVTLLTFTPV